MKPLVAYLDQKDWIKLGQIKHGISSDTKSCEAYKTIKEAVKSGKIIIPISIVNFIEIGGSKYKAQQMRLIETMYDFSQGYVLQPFEVTLDQEMSMLILKQMSKYSKIEYRRSILDKLNIQNTKYNPSSTYIGKGIGYLFQRNEVKGQLRNRKTGQKLTDEELKKIEDGLISLKAFKMLIKNNDVEKMYSDTKTKYLELVKSIDLFRKKYLQTQKGSKRDDVAGAHFMMFALGDEITKKTMYYTKLFNISVKNSQECMDQIFPQAIQSLPHDQPKIYIQRMLMKMPLLYCLFKLEYERDKHFDKEIKSNDIFDTNALSSALPYCDIIVCEKFFGRAIKKLQLDVEFNTNVFLNIYEFADYLKTIN